jgi:uncharacterized protein YggU (UPF0235/DUF167 family)
VAELELAVTPRAAAERVGPFRGGVLAVRVTRPATGGEANRAVLRLVSRAIGVAPSRLAITAGERGRRKRVTVDGIDEAELARRLAALPLD